MSSFPECPPTLKPVQHFLKTAAEHEGRDACVVYWARVHSLQLALKLGPKGPDESKLLMALMDWLEKEKKVRHDDETITNEIAAQAHLENYALKLFLYADKQDRASNFGKNVVKAFYTSGVIYDILVTFGDLTEEVMQNRKYAKWKAAYIHNCLKNGETPVPGPMANEDDENGTGTSDEGVSMPGDSAPSRPADEPTPDVTAATDALPAVPYKPDPSPGGFQPYASSNTPPDVTPTSSSSVNLTADQITKAQKYCKWASSALNYDDASTAITNLRNALQLLQTGHDPA